MTRQATDRERSDAPSTGNLHRTGNVTDPQRVVGDFCLWTCDVHFAVRVTNAVPSLLASSQDRQPGCTNYRTRQHQ